MKKQEQIQAIQFALKRGLEDQSPILCVQSYHTDGRFDAVILPKLRADFGSELKNVDPENTPKIEATLKKLGEPFVDKKNVTYYDPYNLVNNAYEALSLALYQDKENDKYRETLVSLREKNPEKVKEALLKFKDENYDKWKIDAATTPSEVKSFTSDIMNKIIEKREAAPTLSGPRN